MRHIAGKLLAASAALALAGFAGAPALAQGDEAAEAEIVEIEDAFDAQAEDDAGLAAPEEAAADEAAADVEEAPAVAEASDPGVTEAPAAGASDGAVLAAPGTTDESNPGGSTKPGTTPDD